MAHEHSVYDGDTHFKINPITRQIENTTGKVILMQNDHNSERFTFEIPRLIDGHDMSLCNKVEVHYINIDAKDKSQEKGVYPIEDLQISPNSEDVVICSWLISQNATKFAGTLNFVLRYACLTGTTIDYQWYTDIHKGISVSESISNSEYIATEYADILEQWRQELFNGNGGNVDLSGYVKSVNGKTPDENGNVEIAVSGGGLSATASALLLAILKDCYTGSNQDANILALENELLNNSSGGGSSGGEPEEPDVPVEPDEPEEVTLTSISAVANQDSAPVGTAASELDITVTAHYSDGTTAEVTDYSISGTVASGENTFTIVYGGKTTTVTVTGSALVYSLYNRDMNEGTVDFGIELREFKSFTVKLDITPNEALNNKTVISWYYPSANAYGIVFMNTLRAGNSSANTIWKADSENSAISDNNGYPTAAGDRLQWVATYDADTDACAIYLARTPSGSAMVQKSLTGTVDRSKFDGILNAGALGNSHTINTANYFLNACEISFEYTSAEDAAAWFEREV